MVDVRRHQPEVLGLVVGDDEEPTGLTRGTAEMVDVVLDPVPPTLDEPRRRFGVFGGDDPRFARGGAVQADHDEPATFGSARLQHESGIWLLHHQGVGGRVLAQVMAPELIRPHRLVDAGVEDRGVVVGPRQAVVGVGDHLCRGDRAVARVPVRRWRRGGRGFAAACGSDKAGASLRKRSSYRSAPEVSVAYASQR